MKRLIFILSILFLTVINIFSQDVRKITLYADYLQIKSGYEEWDSPGVEVEDIKSDPVRIVVNVEEHLVRIYNQEMDVFSFGEVIGKDSQGSFKIIMYEGKDLKGQNAEIDIVYELNTKKIALIFDYADKDNPDFIYLAPLETAKFEYFNTQNDIL